jgi:hypothetical protein
MFIKKSSLASRGGLLALVATIPVLLKILLPLSSNDPSAFPCGRYLGKMDFVKRDFFVVPTGGVFSLDNEAKI